MLEKQLFEVATAQRLSLPFGMVDDEGIHIDKQVLALILLHQSYGRNQQLLFDRAAKLAPNDTFILELKAKLLSDDGEEAKAVEMYRKALKAKASEARIKYLKKELIEAEKKAEYRKVIGPRTDRKGGG
jgi:tetratricopeptide (TPR) repeat protein